MARPASPGAGPAGHVRIGYARASTARQSLNPQADALRASGVTRIFAEKISTRALIRPELDRAVALAREIRASGAAVTIVVHEHKRLGRGIEREYIRDRTLEGHESARARGKSIGGAAVTDEAMLAAALHLRGQELSLRDIAGRLVIATGKKKGQHPSPATVMRMLREHDEKTAAAVAAG
jgi:DNA invertase Pin-like site-specific DNA recombinase